MTDEDQIIYSSWFLFQARFSLICRNLMQHIFRSTLVAPIQNHSSSWTLISLSILNILFFAPTSKRKTFYSVFNAVTMKLWEKLFCWLTKWNIRFFCSSISGRNNENITERKSCLNESNLLLNQRRDRKREEIFVSISGYFFDDEIKRKSVS